MTPWVCVPSVVFGAILLHFFFVLTSSDPTPIPPIPALPSLAKMLVFSIPLRSVCCHVDIGLRYPLASFGLHVHSVSSQTLLVVAHALEDWLVPGVA